MARRNIPSTILLLLAFVLSGGQSATANTPLTRAEVSSLLNQVRLLPRSQPARKAKVNDVLKPGDGVVTSRRSLAELRFNDGSLARMGEQAVFRFVPKTRSFRLSNGTVLMLIPPGQGRTQVRTPNVTAGIRGSALMIRYDKTTDTSTVIALTNSDISVTNRDGTQTQVLEAGQAVVTVGDRIVGSHDVNLVELYRTSPLLKDLELDNPDAPVEDKAIAQVREETLEGIRSQRRFAKGEGSDRTEEFRLSELNVDSVVADETGRPFGNAVPTVLEIDTTVNFEGEARFPGPAIGLDEPSDSSNGEGNVLPTVSTPPVIVTPPVPLPRLGAEPPIEQAPIVVQPPVVELPSVAQPPVFEPPLVEQLPIAEPPDVIAEPPDVIAEPPDVIAEPPFIDDQIVVDNPTPNGDELDLPGGDDLISDLETPINDADSLPDGIPGEDGTAALQPDDFDHGPIDEGNGLIDLGDVGPDLEETVSPDFQEEQPTQVEDHGIESVPDLGDFVSPGLEAEEPTEVEAPPTDHASDLGDLVSPELPAEELTDVAEPSVDEPPDLGDLVSPGLQAEEPTPVEEPQIDDAPDLTNLVSPGFQAEEPAVDEPPVSLDSSFDAVSPQSAEPTINFTLRVFVDGVQTDAIVQPSTPETPPAANGLIDL